MDRTAEVTSFVADQFEELLELPEVSPDTDFFSAGGGSMEAVRLIAAVLGQGWPVALDDLVTHPTPAGLAGVVAHTLGQSLAAAQNSRSGSLSERELLDFSEGEVLHQCQIAAAPARVSLTRPFSEVADAPVRDLVGARLLVLTGVAVPREILTAAPDVIAKHLRQAAGIPAMPFPLTEGAPGPITVMLGTSSASVLDLRRAVHGRDVAGQVFGVLPVPHRAYPEPPLAAMADELLSAIRELAADRPCRLVGYCTAAWFAAHLARMLDAAGTGVEVVVAINAPPLQQLRDRTFREYLSGTFLADTGRHADLWVELDQWETRWRTGAAGLAAAVDGAVTAVAARLDELLPGISDPRAYDDPETRREYLADLRTSMTFQFAVATGAVPGALPVHALFSTDIAGSAPVCDETIGTVTRSRTFEVAQRMLLRQPDAAAMVLGSYREAASAVHA
jgi:hypothetical protein